MRLGLASPLSDQQRRVVDIVVSETFVQRRPVAARLVPSLSAILRDPDRLRFRWNSGNEWNASVCAFTVTVCPGLDFLGFDGPLKPTYFWLKISGFAHLKSCEGRNKLNFVFLKLLAPVK